MAAKSDIQRIGRKGTAKAEGARFSERIPMAVFYSAVVSLAILVAGGAAGVVSFRILYTNKMSDGWGMMFMELERQALHLKDRLTEERIKGPVAGEIVVRVEPNGALTALSGATASGLALADLGLNRADLGRALTVAELSGRTYLATGLDADRKARRLKIVPVDLPAWMAQTLPERSTSLVYVATRTGRLLYSSDRKATSAGFMARPLVKYFVDAPIAQGQMQITGKHGEDLFGFFYEVPGSNLVLFAETSKTELFKSIYQSLAQFIAVLLGIVVAAVALVQVPLAYISKPVRRLIMTAGEIANGNFNVEVRREGIGEIATLGHAYAKMAQNLKHRDEALNVLNREQKEKIRLDGELKIARGIQENLLPQLQHPRSSGVEVTAKYVPASEVAGDWYYYWHNERLGESLIFVVDVSGHGTGSSMFTAIIAGIFRQLLDPEKPYPVDLFLNSINSRVLEFGNRQWHASVQVVRYVQSSQKIEIHNAGHPPPFFVRRGSDGTKVEVVHLPSEVIGLRPDKNTKTVELDFRAGDCLLMFTDGLYEARNAAGKSHGRKRILNLAKAGGDRSAYQWVESIHSSWLSFRGAHPADDDLCIVAVKAA